jgi:small subunit ribosomal protein S6
MLILPAEADEKVVSTAIDRITKVVSAHGGEVSNIDRWGRRRFAYELGRMTEGYYAVATFTAEPTAQPEVERILNLADEVIRHKVLVVPAKGRNAKRADARGDEQRSNQTEAEASPAPA